MDESIEVPIYNLWYDEQYIVLNPEEEICPECKGEGVTNRKGYGYHICNFCLGRGKVDWIERIRGV